MKKSVTIYSPTHATRKLTVIFVGAFRPLPGSSVRGGQLAACRAIIDSPLSEQVDWLLLESMMESLPPPPLRRRAWRALVRVARFSWWLFKYKVDAAMIFTSNELSLVEKGTMAILAKLRGLRVVLCPRSGYLIQEYRRFAFTRCWLRLVISCSDKVVCQGLRWREFFVSISGRSIAHFPIIYNIVPEKDFTLMALPDRETAKQALLVGWVERNKGIFDLLDVVDRFQLEMQGIRFVICGNGSGWEEFKFLLAERKLEHFFELRGWVDGKGKQEALQDSDFCLMLSHREGMPNALLEAMAAGRPVVATCVGAVADIVEEGQNGFLCEPRDIDEIGFRILDLARSKKLRSTMGARARESVRNIMTSDVIWRNWLSALRADGQSLRSEGKSQ